MLRRGFLKGLIGAPAAVVAGKAIADAPTQKLIDVSYVPDPIGGRREVMSCTFSCAPEVRDFRDLIRR